MKLSFSTQKAQCVSIANYLQGRRVSQFYPGDEGNITSETVANSYQNTRRYIPEDLVLAVTAIKISHLTQSFNAVNGNNHSSW
jgi:hypothetical protein